MYVISNPTPDEIVIAANALKNGHLVSFPTETVYGLGADATNEKAVGKIYMAKGRPKNHPVIVHISSANQVENWAREIPEYAISLASAYWPGPMTLILKRNSRASDFITGGQESVGLRVPNQQVALALTREFEKLGGFGIAAPSANRFGSISPTTAQAVEEELGKFLGSEDLILDKGQCEIGVESSIIDCTQVNPVVLRPGAITKELIEEINLDNKVFGIDNSPHIIFGAGNFPKNDFNLNYTDLDLHEFILKGIIGVISHHTFEEFIFDKSVDISGNLNFIHKL